MNVRANYYRRLIAPGVSTERAKTWTYHLTWKRNGKPEQIKKGGFLTKREAQDAAKPKIEEIEMLGGRPAGDTIRAYLDSWLASRTVEGRARSTVESYRVKLNTYVLPRIGDMKLAAVDVLTLERLYADLLASGGRNGRSLSARTVRYVHSILHKALRDAVRKRLIASNPAEAATAPTSRAARAPEARVWTPAELGAFLKWAETAEDYYRPLWWTIAFTGLRRAEACGLEWSDIDLETGVLLVQRTWNQWGDEVFEGEGKSDRARRVIDLDDGTLAVLRSWRRRQSEMRLMVGTGWRPTNKVFTSPDGDALRPDTVTQAWRRTVRRSGLPTIRLHDLRHSHATHQLAVRANHREVADRLGHADASFTMRTYVHTLPGAQRNNAEAVAALIRAATEAVTNSVTNSVSEAASDSA
jgi:integrase